MADDGPATVRWYDSSKKRARDRVREESFGSTWLALAKVYELDNNVKIERVDLILDKTGMLHRTFDDLDAWLHEGDD